MNRRAFLISMAAASLAARSSANSPRSTGERLAEAARAQLGVTTGYDPVYTRLKYPGGDVDRSTGVCADVIIRAARDAFGLDLQKLVHEDMATHFDAYPSRRVWGERAADANIDHRRVLNLETYFQRCGAQLWHASRPTLGDSFPPPLAPGDIVTWLLDARLPHIGILVSSSRVVHNIGRGVEETGLGEFGPHRAIAHYRWPASI
jgi:uncharacterized protein YijF (DUF1287 family)